ncbi:myb-like protein X [Ruditapes philippinarum]|uniref:myb-like protein X n=1 Tax=Ruditapes philippinarum TaxID=129788 RepID=UPI00295AC069|nr:myb-like protein X [Ruditapes philippinarum]
MRKRSKRRRENRGTLIDLVTEVKNMAEVSKMKLTEEAVNSENPDIMLNTKDTPESTLTADDASKPGLNQMEEPKSSKVTKKLETNKNESKIKNDSDNTKDIKPDVSMNKGKGLKKDNKKVKKSTANQELSADKTTKTTGKDNIAKLNHTKRQNKKKGENDKSEITREVSINPGVDKDNETSAISGYEPNTEKEVSTEVINLAQKSDSNNTFKEQDENKMKTDDITNKDIYQNTTTNETFQNMDFDKKENTNINDKTLEKVNVEDGRRSHESTQVEKTDEDELSKDDHDRSKNIHVESNDLQNESEIQNDNTKDIKPDVSSNKGKGLKKDNKKVKKPTANQELSADKATKTTGKDNIAKLNHTKRQNKKKGENNKSEKTREVSINPDTDTDNDTSAISGNEPNTEKEARTGREQNES